MGLILRIGNWHWGLGIGIGDWELVLGIGIRIEIVDGHCKLLFGIVDWGLRFLIRIDALDRILEYGIED